MKDQNFDLVWSEKPKFGQIFIWKTKIWIHLEMENQNFNTVCSEKPKFLHILP